MIWRRGPAAESLQPNGAGLPGAKRPTLSSANFRWDVQAAGERLGACSVPGSSKRAFRRARMRVRSDNDFLILMPWSAI
jgi:hypothetical protein